MSGTMSLLRALLWFGASYGLAIVGYAATNAVAGRWFGREGYALFVVVVTVTAALGQLGLLGAHRAGLREAAQLGSGEDDTERLHTLRQDVRVASRLTLPTVAVGAGLVTYLLLDRPPVERTAIAVAFAILVALGGLQKLWANLLRGLGRIRLASLLEGRSGGALVSGLQALLLVVAWQAAPRAGLAAAMAALAVGFAVPVAVGGLVAARHWAHLAPSRRRRWASLADTIRRNWRFAVNQMAVYLAGAVDIWIASIMLPPTEASEFAAAQRLALLLVIPATSIQVVFAPMAARLLARGEHARLQRVLRSGATAAFGVTSVLWIPMLLAPALLLELMFGAEFRGAAVPLFLLTLGNMANVTVGLCGTALTMSRHEGAVAMVQSASVVVRVAVGGLAAWQFGVAGLSVAAALITVATYAAMWWQARRLLGLWTHVTLHPSLTLLRRTAS